MYYVGGVWEGCGRGVEAPGGYGCRGVGEMRRGVLHPTLSGGVHGWGVCVTDDDDDDASPSLASDQSQLRPRPREWPPLSPGYGKGACV